MLTAFDLDVVEKLP